VQAGSSWSSNPITGFKYLPFSKLPRIAGRVATSDAFGDCAFTVQGTSRAENIEKSKQQSASVRNTDWVHFQESGQLKSTTVEIVTDSWHNIASLTMSAPVQYFLGVLTRALRRERHFALVEGAPYQPQGSLVIGFRSETQFDPCISSVTTSIMITTSDSPVKGSGIPNQLLGV